MRTPWRVGYPGLRQLTSSPKSTEEILRAQELVGRDSTCRPGTDHGR